MSSTPKLAAVPPASDALVEALAQAMLKIVQPKKNSKVNAGAKQYKFANLAECMEAVREPLAEHGLVVTQEIDFHLTEATPPQQIDVLTTTLRHVSGQTLSCRYRLEAQRGQPQAMGSAITYARRYSLCALLGIVADEDDDDGRAASGWQSGSVAHPSRAPEPPAKRPRGRPPKSAPAPHVEPPTPQLTPDSTAVDQFLLVIDCAQNLDEFMRLKPQRALTAAEKAEVLPTYTARKKELEEQAHKALAAASAADGNARMLARLARDEAEDAGTPEPPPWG